MKIKYFEKIKTDPQESKDFEKMMDLSQIAAFLDVLLYTAPGIITKEAPDNLLVGDIFRYLANEGPDFIQQTASSIYNLYYTGGAPSPETYFDAAVRIVPPIILELLSLMALLWVPFLTYKIYKNRN